MDENDKPKEDGLTLEIQQAFFEYERKIWALQQEIARLKHKNSIRGWKTTKLYQMARKIVK